MLASIMSEGQSGFENFSSVDLFSLPSSKIQIAPEGLHPGPSDETGYPRQVHKFN